MPQGGDRVRVIEYAKGGSNGVTKTIKSEGDGRSPQMGQCVHVKYSVFRDDGHVITSSPKAEVTLGMRQLWGTGGDLGLLTMKVGERALITCEHEFSGTDSEGVNRVTLEVTLLAIISRSEVTMREYRTIGILGGLTILFAVLFQWKEGHLW
jgi:hypothetical protein